MYCFPDFADAQRQLTQEPESRARGSGVGGRELERAYACQRVCHPAPFLFFSHTAVLQAFLVLVPPLRPVVILLPTQHAQFQYQIPLSTPSQTSRGNDGWTANEQVLMKDARATSKSNPSRRKRLGIELPLALCYKFQPHRTTSCFPLPPIFHSSRKGPLHE